MTIPPIFEILSASPEVTAIAGSRIFGAGIATQGADQPYVTWQIVAGVPGNSLSCGPGYDSKRVQVDCYALSETKARQLAEAVSNAIEATTYIVFGPVNSFEDETKLYRWTMDASFILQR